LIRLHFNLARNSGTKKADFKTNEDRIAYVTAEMTDTLVREMYYQYQAQRTKAEREAFAPKLDAVRWQFYERWRKETTKPPLEVA